jgi:hypothetical protein
MLGNSIEATEPAERVMLEQLLLAHHRLASLHMKAEAATNIEHAKIYNACAARFMAEIRRMGLAIRQYKLPPSAKSFAVVHQQNVVASGQQHVQFVDAGKQKETLSVRDEVNGNTLAGRFSGDGIPPQESQACGSRAAERLQEAAVD